jgi:hypothetical protein
MEIHNDCYHRFAPNKVKPTLLALDLKSMKVVLMSISTLPVTIGSPETQAHPDLVVHAVHIEAVQLIDL